MFSVSFLTFTRVVLLATALSICLPCANAFQGEAQKPDQAKEEQARESEEIVITGKRSRDGLLGRLDDGFAAFKSGDYAKAEYHFQFLSSLEETHIRSQNFFLTTLVSDRARNSGSDGGISGVQSGFNGARLAETHGIGTTKKDLKPAKVRITRAHLIYMQGISEARQEKYKEALISLRRTLKVDPNHYDARVDIALLQAMKGDIRAARKNLLRLAEIVEYCDRKGIACGYEGNLKERVIFLATKLVG